MEEICNGRRRYSEGERTDGTGRVGLGFCSGDILIKVGEVIFCKDIVGGKLK